MKTANIHNVTRIMCGKTLTSLYFVAVTPTPNAGYVLADTF